MPRLGLEVMEVAITTPEVPNTTALLLLNIIMGEGADGMEEMQVGTTVPAVMATVVAVAMVVLTRPADVMGVPGGGMAQASLTDLVGCSSVSVLVGLLGLLLHR